jgi:outer membrane protein insertion porin family
MLKKLPWLVMLLLTVQFLGAEIIEEIRIEGNKKVSRETVQFYMKSRQGGIYDEEKLKEDFKILWETGFFENIRIVSDNGSSGKIVSMTLTENPLISAVTYKTGKKVKESDITQKLQESNITIQAFSYYSPAKIRKAKKIITDMLMKRLKTARSHCLSRSMPAQKPGSARCFFPAWTRNCFLPVFCAAA